MLFHSTRNPLETAVRIETKGQNDYITTRRQRWIIEDFDMEPETQCSLYPGMRITV